MNPFKKIVYRFVFMLFFVLIMPAISIFIVLKGFESPEYIFKGILNLNTGQTVHYSFIDVYFKYLFEILHLNFGKSIVTDNSVFYEICLGLKESAPYILLSFALTILFLLIISLKGKSTKRFKVKNIGFIAFVPIIVLSYMVQFFLFKSGIEITYFVQTLSASVILASIPVFIGTKQIRNMIETINRSDFYSFHISCGFTPSYIWDKLTSKFIWIEILNIVEYIIIYFFSFCVFVEIPFNIYGIGYKFVKSINSLDYPMIIGFCLFQMLLLNLVGMAVDLIKTKLDTRFSSLQ